MVLKSKQVLFLFIIFCVLILPQTVSAQDEPFTLDVLTEKQTVYVGNSAEYIIEVTNNQDETKDVQLVPTISYNSWFPTPQNYTISIGANETKVITVRIVPSLDTSSGN
ncbi:MAG: hypothetical protein U9P44_04235, partial [archaeon]|nr:hypothetical protein [archaeon]